MNQANDDQELIQRLLHRQRSGWQDLVDRFERTVYSRIRLTLKLYSRHFDPTDIEDLCAEVFFGLLKNDLQSLRGFNGKCRLATWLSIIAHRQALKWLRRAERNQENVDGEFACENGEPSGAMMAREETAEMMDSISSLEISDQTILRLYFMEQNSYQEISKKMGISINSVGPKLNRARQRLKKKMRVK